MKITRDKALAMTAYCRRMGLTYASEGQYPNSVSAGLKVGTKAPNGVAYHFPKGFEWRGVKQPNDRAYVLWQGEPVPAIEEACAFILMTTKRKSLYIVRCKSASKAAQQLEPPIVPAEKSIDAGAPTDYHDFRVEDFL
jgi:hypothetical protein